MKIDTNTLRFRLLAFTLVPALVIGLAKVASAFTDDGHPEKHHNEVLASASAEENKKELHGSVVFPFTPSVPNNIKPGSYTYEDLGRKVDGWFIECIDYSAKRLTLRLEISKQNNANPVLEVNGERFEEGLKVIEHLGTRVIVEQNSQPLLQIKPSPNRVIKSTSLSRNARSKLLERQQQRNEAHSRS